MKKRLKWMIGIVGLLTLPVIGGCDSKSGEKGTKEAEAEGAEKTEQEPGLEEVTFAFQPQENPEALAPDADRLAKYMTDKIGIKSKVFLPTSYAAVVEALRSENADVAYFSGWPYLIASQKADVDLLVVEERNGNPFYWSQWYVPADSDIEKLADLKGREVSFTSPTSTSGYLFPVAKVIEEGGMKQGQDPKKFFGEVIYAGGYQQSLMALVNGRVEAAAASNYAFDEYLTDEQKKNVRVLSKQGPVPTHGIAVRSALPDEVKANIKKAFLDLNKEENNELLTSIYGAEKLVEQTHEKHVGKLEKALKLVGDKKDIEGFGAGSGSGSGSGSGHADDKGAEAGSGDGSGEGSGSGSGHEKADKKGAAKGSGEGSGSGHTKEKGEK
jgi:phosphonate transport system substrate-binding protein